MKPVLVACALALTTLSTAAAGLAGFHVSRALVEGPEEGNAPAAGEALAPRAGPTGSAPGPVQWLNVTFSTVAHARDPSCAATGLPAGCRDVRDARSDVPPAFRILPRGETGPFHVFLTLAWEATSPTGGTLRLAIHPVGSGEPAAEAEGAAPLPLPAHLPPGDYEARVTAPSGAPAAAQTDIHLSIHGPVERPW